MIGTLTKEHILEVIKILKNDDIALFREFMTDFSRCNLTFSEIIPEIPKHLRRSPYLCHVAAYYGAVQCLKYIINMTEDLRIEDNSYVSFLFLKQSPITQCI